MIATMSTKVMYLPDRKTSYSPNILENSIHFPNITVDLKGCDKVFKTEQKIESIHIMVKNLKYIQRA